MLAEEAVDEALHIFGNVLRQVLRELAGDARVVDGERDAVLSALHQPRVVVHNGKGALRRWAEEEEKGERVGVRKNAAGRCWRVDERRMCAHAAMVRCKAFC